MEIVVSDARKNLEYIGIESVHQPLLTVHFNPTSDSIDQWSLDWEAHDIDRLEKEEDYYEQMAIACEDEYALEGHNNSLEELLQ